MLAERTSLREHQFTLPLRTERDLRLFVEKTFGAIIPDTVVVPGHSTPWRAFADSYFARSSINVWIASRGFGGKSYLLALLGLTEALTLEANVKILGGSGAQSRNVQNYVSTVLYNKNEAMKRAWARPPLSEISRFVRGNSIQSLMASSTSVRGPHPQRLRLDECVAGDAEIPTPVGPKLLRDVRAGDTVYGWNGNKATPGMVRAAKYKGVRNTISLELSNGKALICTSDHKVLAENGWTEARKLQPGDLLFSMPYPAVKVAVLSISNGPVTDVWDIEVSGLHSFVAQGVIVHNCDEMTLPLFDASLGQAMARVENRRIVIPAQTTISSTHHYPDRTMTEVLKRASANGWPVHRWSFHETSAEGGWLLPEQVEEKRREVPVQMFRVEFELSEPSAEGRAIMSEWIEATFDAGLGEHEGRSGEYIEVEPPERDARYATGADWAKEQDYTVIITWRMDVRPHRLVAFERRQREPWPVIVSRFDQRVERYGGKAQHDATGLGGVIDDYKQSKSDGVVMIGNRRRDLFSNYIAALEDGAFIAPKIQFMADEHLYATVNDLYGSGHPPDSIVAAALAYDAGGQKRVGGVVKTLSQRQNELRNSVILRYTGTRSFQLAIGGTMQNIRPGWYSRVERGLGEAIASQFPEHFVTSNR